jgi:transcriptional regulator with XRE-family HTH domain
LSTTLVRDIQGDVIRDYRMSKGATLRQVATRAGVSLGYLCEVEQGKKEASSEILASITSALELPLPYMFALMAEKAAKNA